MIRERSPKITRGCYRLEVAFAGVDELVGEASHFIHEFPVCWSLHLYDLMGIGLPQDGKQQITMDTSVDIHQRGIASATRSPIPVLVPSLEIFRIGQRDNVHMTQDVFTKVAKWLQVGDILTEIVVLDAASLPL